MHSHYHTPVDMENENNSHSCVIRMIGFNKRVLEAGCASGHVSEVMKARGCSVVGVEIDAEAAHAADQWTERVIVGDFDDGSAWKELDEELFDVVLFGDVLEHLKNPLATLRESTKHLVTSGMVVLSVPNIAHADVKIALLKGSFPYSDSGLLDRTHVHFFTKESLLELVEEAGLVPTEFFRVSAPVFSTEIGVQRSDVDDQVLEAILVDRESETYQFVIKAVRDDGERSIKALSNELIGLTDRLHDATRRHADLLAQFDALQSTNDALSVQHGADLHDLTILRRRMDTVKRFLPMSLLRRVRGPVSPANDDSGD